MSPNQRAQTSGPETVLPDPPRPPIESLWCRRGDSNSHSLAATSPSSWRVYQFHHVGFAAPGYRPRERRVFYFGTSLALDPGVSVPAGLGTSPAGALGAAGAVCTWSMTLPPVFGFRFAR